MTNTNTKQTKALATLAAECLRLMWETTDLAEHCEGIEAAMSYYDDVSDADTFIEWYRETYVYSAEIIYYHTAMTYLAEHDPALTESLSLAADMGSEVSDLNSETLATLLLQQNLVEELQGMSDALSEYFIAIET